MMIRDQISNLIDMLSRPQPETLDRALVIAALVLEQDFLHGSVRLAQLDPEVRTTLPPGYAERRRAEIRQDFQQYHRQGLLPIEYINHTVTQAEREALCRTLVRLLDGPPAIAGQAASALSYCAEPPALSALARAVRRYAAQDEGVAAQTIGALGRVLIAAVSRTSLAADQPEVVAEAVAALRSAAEDASASRSVRELAQGEVGRAAVHLGQEM